MTKTVWQKIGEDGLFGTVGKMEQDAISKYDNIAKLTQEMPAPPEGSEADKAGQKLQNALKNSSGTGINDTVAKPLNDALAREEDRKFVIKLAQEHPDALSKAVDDIKAHPNDSKQILTKLEETYPPQKAPDVVVAKNEPANTRPQPKTPTSPPAPVSTKAEPLHPPVQSASRAQAPAEKSDAAMVGEIKHDATMAAAYADIAQKAKEAGESAVAMEYSRKSNTLASEAKFQMELHPDAKAQIIKGAPQDQKDLYAAIEQGKKGDELVKFRYQESRKDAGDLAKEMAVESGRLLANNPGDSQRTEAAFFARQATAAAQGAGGSDDKLVNAAVAFDKNHSPEAAEKMVEAWRQNPAPTEVIYAEVPKAPTNGAAHPKAPPSHASGTNPAPEIHAEKTPDKTPAKPAGKPSLDELMKMAERDPSLMWKNAGVENLTADAAEKVKGPEGQQKLSEIMERGDLGTQGGPPITLPKTLSDMAENIASKAADQVKGPEGQRELEKIMEGGDLGNRSEGFTKQLSDMAKSIAAAVDKLPEGIREITEHVTGGRGGATLDRLLETATLQDVMKSFGEHVGDPSIALTGQAKQPQADKGIAG